MQTKFIVEVFMWRLSIAITAIILSLGLLSHARGQDAEKEEGIRNGSVVRLEYTLLDEKGKLIESNKGKEPLTYTHGAGQIIPGLEKELVGMKVSEEKHIQVKPEEGYGVVDPRGFKEVPKEKIPAEGLQVGAALYAKGANGEGFPVRVREIKDSTVVLDFNHPLAGKTLTFDVKVLNVQSGDHR